MSLQKKLILILFGFTLLPMAVVGIWGYLDARKVLFRSQMNFVESLTDLNVKRLEEFFVDLKEDIQTLAQHPEIYAQASMLTNPEQHTAGPSASKIEEVLDKLLLVKRRVSQYLNIMLLDKQGRLMYTLHGIANAQNFNALIDKNKKRILERLDAGYYVSDFFAADLNTGPFYMLMMAPILGPDGNSAGIIVFEIRMSPVYRMILETTGLGKTGEILIAVKSGDTILFFNPMHSALPKTVGVAEDTIVCPVLGYDDVVLVDNLFVLGIKDHIVFITELVESDICNIRQSKLTRDGGCMRKEATVFSCESSQRAHVEVRKFYPFEDANDVLNVLCFVSCHFLNEFLVASCREAKTFSMPVEDRFSPCKSIAVFIILIIEKWLLFERRRPEIQQHVLDPVLSACFQIRLAL